MSVDDPGPEEVARLTALLTAEHAAVYAYGVLGARLDDQTRPLAQQADDAHRASRDALAALLAARSAPAPATRAAYDVAVAGRTEALALAVRVEQGLAVRWRDLVGGTDDRDLRRFAAAGLTAAAVRATGWRTAVGGAPRTAALPGTAG